MKVLLSFTGFHDPFSPSAATGEMRAGPIMTVVAERQFDRVYLFSTPKAAEISVRTAAAIEERHPGTKAEILEVPLKDPTNYLGILRQLRCHFKELNLSHPDAEYAISVSSGTPHMHACWLLLAASGEIPATILQSAPPEFVPEGRPLIREIDIHQKDFPTITRPVDGPEHADDDESSVIAACRELGIVGDDPAFRRALHEAFIYSQYDDFHVLLLGETGSGKEHFAQFIHHLGPRSSRPMVTVNCSSIGGAGDLSNGSRCPPIRTEPRCLGQSSTQNSTHATQECPCEGGRAADYDRVLSEYEAFRQQGPHWHACARPWMPSCQGTGTHGGWHGIPLCTARPLQGN